MFVVVNPYSGVQPGETAPEFTLPAVDRAGHVSLSDYRGKSAVLLAIYRGLHCPFCRYAIAQLGMLTDRLRAERVEPLGVVATKLEMARLYLRHRPTRLPLVADPDLITHRAYRLPRPELTPELMKVVTETRTNATGELQEPLPIFEAGEALNRLHGFVRDDAYNAERATQLGPVSPGALPSAQLRGQFLIDRNGIVRWTNVECASDGVEGFGKFPTRDELLKIARTFA